MVYNNVDIKYLRELSRSWPPIVIIIMSEFMVSGTYICNTAHYTHYKICYSNIL